MILDCGKKKKKSLYSLSIYFHKILITLILIYHLCKIPLILTGRLPGCEVLHHNSLMVQNPEDGVQDSTW